MKTVPKLTIILGAIVYPFVLYRFFMFSICHGCHFSQWLRLHTPL